MIPDDANSKTVGVFYIWDEGEQDWIKIGNGTLENTEIIDQKRAIARGFGGKLGHF